MSSPQPTLPPPPGRPAPTPGAELGAAPAGGPQSGGPATPGNDLNAGPAVQQSALNLKTIVDNLRQFEMNNPPASPIVRQMMGQVRELQMVLVQTQPVVEPPTPPVGG